MLGAFHTHQKTITYANLVFYYVKTLLHEVVEEQVLPLLPKVIPAGVGVQLHPVLHLEVVTHETVAVEEAKSELAPNQGHGRRVRGAEVIPPLSFAAEYVKRDVQLVTGR